MKTLPFDSLVWSLQKRFDYIEMTMYKQTYLSLLIIFVVHTLLLNTLVMIYFISVIYFTAVEHTCNDIFYICNLFYLNPYKIFLWYREQYQYLKL